jgi:predicted metalloprotease with PDZ domain
MRRLIICTGRVNPDGAENPESATDTAQACLLIWSNTRRANMKELADNSTDEKALTQKDGYVHEYKIYQYVRYCTQSFGIKAIPAPKDYLELMELESGGLITEVLHGSPAEKAGIEEGDVLISLNDVPFAGDSDFKKFNYAGENRAILNRNGSLIARNVYVPS